MYFSRIRLDSAIEPIRLVKVLRQNSYGEHQTIWKFFDCNPDSKRDFLYRHVIEYGQTKYYVVSERIPTDITGIWNIDPPKIYNPVISKGQGFRFMLRANPVIDIRCKNGRSSRHDVVMYEQKRIGYKQMSRTERIPLPQLVQNVCTEWLDTRSSSNGFLINRDHVRADGYRRHRNSIPNRNNTIQFSSVDFEGILSVTDPDLFKSMLFKGIGKSKAFGCGLMLIRRLK